MVSLQVCKILCLNYSSCFPVMTMVVNVIVYIPSPLGPLSQQISIAVSGEKSDQFHTGSGAGTPLVDQAGT